VYTRPVQGHTPAKAISVASSSVLSHRKSAALELQAMSGV